MVYKNKFQLKKHKGFKNSLTYHLFKICSMLLCYSLIKDHLISETPNVLKYNLI